MIKSVHQHQCERMLIAQGYNVPLKPEMLTSDVRRKLMYAFDTAVKNLEAKLVDPYVVDDIIHDLCAMHVVVTKIAAMYGINEAPLQDEFNKHYMSVYTKPTHVDSVRNLRQNELEIALGKLINQQRRS